MVSALCVRLPDQTVTDTPSQHTVVVSRCAVVSGSPPGGEKYYNGMMRHSINQLGVAHMAADVAPVGANWGQLGSTHAKWATRDLAVAPMNSAFVMAGETGIEPATCGCGACCPLFRDAQGRTRALLRWPIFDAPKCQDVHQRSPALGSTVGSKAPATQHALFVWIDERGSPKQSDVLLSQRRLHESTSQLPVQRLFTVETSQ
jgi:hypothetical protein